MFVQLRRVVYLLVLLYLCACTVCATSDSGSTANPEHSGDTKEPDGSNPRITVKRMVQLKGEAEEFLVEGKGCLSLWEEDLVSSSKSLSLVKKGTEETRRRVDKIVELAGTGEELSGGAGGLEQIYDLLEKAENAIQQTGTAADTAKTSIERAKNEQGLCQTVLGGVEKVESKLDEAIKGFAGLLNEKNGRVEEKTLAAECRERKEALVGYKEKHKNMISYTEGNATQTEKQLQESKEAIKAAGEKLKELNEQLKVWEEEETKNHRDGYVTDIRKDIDNVVKVSGEVKRKIEELSSTEGTQKKKDATLTEAKEKVKSATEKAERMREKRLAEEQAMLEKEEQARQVTENVKEVAEVVGNMDGAVNPALVHGPLLLLLCVLGCTLVC